MNCGDCTILKRKSISELKENIRQMKNENKQQHTSRWSKCIICQEEFLDKEDVPSEDFESGVSLNLPIQINFKDDNCHCSYDCQWCSEEYFHCILFNEDLEYDKDVGLRRCQECLDKVSKAVADLIERLDEPKEDFHPDCGKCVGLVRNMCRTDHNINPGSLSCSNIRNSNPDPSNCNHDIPLGKSKCCKCGYQFSGDLFGNKATCESCGSTMETNGTLYVCPKCEKIEDQVESNLPSSSTLFCNILSAFQQGIIDQKAADHIMDQQVKVEQCQCGSYMFLDGSYYRCPVCKIHRESGAGDK